MGYTTDFDGRFSVTPTLTPEHRAYLKAFNETRRMTRNAQAAEKLPDPIREAAGLPIGEYGAYFVGGLGFMGQDRDDTVIRDEAPDGQPGYWCQWIPTDDGTAIEWDQGEKFYEYVEWLSYLLRNFLIPWGYTLNGVVEWQGEDPGDAGQIKVVDNEISTRERIDAYGSWS